MEPGFEFRGESLFSSLIIPELFLLFAITVEFPLLSAKPSSRGFELIGFSKVRFPWLLAMEPGFEINGEVSSVSGFNFEGDSLGITGLERFILSVILFVAIGVSGFDGFNTGFFGDASRVFSIFLGVSSLMSDWISGDSKFVWKTGLGFVISGLKIGKSMLGFLASWGFFISGWIRGISLNVVWVSWGIWAIVCGCFTGEMPSGFIDGSGFGIGFFSSSGSSTIIISIGSSASTNSCLLNK